jgi:hypothetical protein
MTWPVGSGRDSAIPRAMQDVPRKGTGLAGLERCGRTGISMGADPDVAGRDGPV